MYKEFDAAIGGVLCADLENPNPDKALEMVNAIQPGIEYDPVNNLILLENSIPKELTEKWEAFVKETREAGGYTLGGIVPNAGIPLSFLFGQTRTVLVANVGKGLLGRMQRKNLEEHISPENLFLNTVNEDDSYTAILKKDGRSFYCHQEGANASFGQGLDITPFAKSRFALLGYPPIIGNWRQRGNLANFLAQIQKEGTRIYMDMCSIKPGTSPAKTDWNSILRESLPYVEGFTPSLNEAVYIFNPEFYSKAELTAKREKREILDVMTEMNPEILRHTAEHYLKMGARRVFLTCGIEGAYVRTGDDENYAWRNREVFVNTIKEKVRKSTKGAGDNAKALITYCASREEEYGPVRTAIASVSGGALTVEIDESFGAYHSIREVEQASNRDLLFFNPGEAFIRKGIYFIGSHDRKLIAA